MSYVAYRHTRWTLAFAFVCGASLLAGHEARAQASVSSPFVQSVCLDPSDVTGALADPNGYYAASPNCESLCKQARKDCMQYVKAASSCQTAEIGDDAAYAKRECEVEFEHGTQTSVCKTEIEHAAGDDRKGARASRDAALHTCDDWEHACEASCP